jgi:predicted esterase
MRNKIFLAGVSQGGSIATGVALRDPQTQKLAGVAG